MGSRKGEDTPDRKRRRMPYMAKIKREAPFSAADSREIYRACRRVAAAAEHCSFAGWGKDAGFLVYHFTTWAKARAMQHWIDRSGIADRPIPRMGPTNEEKAEAERKLMEWALGSGAAREIVQAYRRYTFAGGGHAGALCDAYNIAKELGCQRDGLNDAVEYIIEWAQRNHGEWFYRCKPPEETPAEVAKPIPAAAVTPAPIRAPAVNPLWRPTF